MFFSHKKKHDAAEAATEAKIQAIHKDMYDRIDRSTNSIDELTMTLSDMKGITPLFFLATGGRNRMEKKK